MIKNICNLKVYNLQFRFKDDRLKYWLKVKYGYAVLQRSLKKYVCSNDNTIVYMKNNNNSIYDFSPKIILVKDLDGCATAQYAWQNCRKSQGNKIHRKKKSQFIYYMIITIAAVQSILLAKGDEERMT